TPAGAVPTDDNQRDGLQPVPPATPPADRLRVRRGRARRGCAPSAVGRGTGPEVEVRRVQPYEAAKRYLCPGCNQWIEPGTGHLVVVPLDAPDLRRHSPTA